METFSNLSFPSRRWRCGGNCVGEGGDSLLCLLERKTSDTHGFHGRVSRKRELGAWFRRKWCRLHTRTHRPFQTQEAVWPGHAQRRLATGGEWHHEKYALFSFFKAFGMFWMTTVVVIANPTIVLHHWTPPLSHSPRRWRETRPAQKDSLSPRKQQKRICIRPLVDYVTGIALFIKTAWRWLHSAINIDHAFMQNGAICLFFGAGVGCSTSSFSFPAQTVPCRSPRRLRWLLSPDRVYVTCC